MSDEIKFPLLPVPSGLYYTTHHGASKDDVRQFSKNQMSDYARAAVALNAPQVPQDAELDALILELRDQYYAEFRKCPELRDKAADAITALRQYNASIRDYVSGAATIAALKERLDRAEADLAAAQQTIAALQLQIGIGGQGSVISGQIGAMNELKKQRDDVRADLATARKEIEALRSLLTWKYADKKDPVIEAAIDAARGK